MNGPPIDELSSPADRVGPGWRTLSEDADKKSNGGVTILDCSLRDGGYLNNWNFPLPLIYSHVEHLARIGVRMAEIGFRSPASRTGAFRGITWHSPSSIIHELKVKFPQLELGVMVNEADFPDPKTLLDRFRRDSDEPGLDFVRVATHPDGISNSFALSDRLQDLGFKVFLNLMQASKLSNETMTSALSAHALTSLSGIYLADSFGAMKPTRVGSIVNLLRSVTNLPVGVHFHDNLGLALANSMEACAAGATLVDGTILGIGRGAGNTRLENLVLEHMDPLDLQALVSLVECWKTWVASTEGLTEWGPSLEYALSAKANIHPTYIQRMVETELYSPFERASVIQELASRESSSFSDDALNVGADWFDAAGQTDEAARGLFSGERVLLIGGGSSVELYRDEIARTVRNLDLTTCVVGSRSADFPSDYQIISHPLTVLADRSSLAMGKTLIWPKDQFAKRGIYPPSPDQSIAVDLKISANQFGFDGKTVFVTSSRSSIFALALLAGLDCEEVFIAGFDGFSSGDARNREFEVAVAHLEVAGVRLTSLTPSIFNVRYRGFA